MNARKFMFRGLCLMTFAIAVLSSCGSKSSEVHEYKMNRELVAEIGRYVTCPADTVEMMLSSSDSTIQWVEPLSLESLCLDNEAINRDLVASYNKEIHTILRLYGTYDTVTNFPTSEANAAFAWHEIANALIAEHYGKERVDTADVEKLFKVIDGILYLYAAGTQGDMNNAAWRWAVLSDYRLIGAYKALYDSCDDPSLLQSVHDSYVNVLERYRNRCEQIDGYWTDLPREMACMQMSMMDEKREFIDDLNLQYRQGRLSVQSVKSELDKRPKDVDDWNIDDY